MKSSVSALLSQAAPNSLQAKPGPMSDGGMSSSEIRNDQRNTGLIAAVSVLAVALMVVLLLGVLFFYRTSHSNDDGIIYHCDRSFMIKYNIPDGGLGPKI